jgi:hypothetical protein
LSGRAFLPVVVGSATEASDLHWKFDAIARLADAHTAANHAGAQTQPRPQQDAALHVKHYVQPGALWWALDWVSALAQQKDCRHGAALTPDTPKGWEPQKGVLLLIDEIDKAEPDLPNGLLEALANGAFDVPLLGTTVKRSSTCAAPLIVITTNEERELPAAFLRRCLVLTIALPEGNALKQYLIDRGALHFSRMDKKHLAECAELLMQDRNAARQQNCYMPGLAEYLDLLRAIDQLGTSAIDQLQKLKQFYFEKQAIQRGV